jgi:hypothetical protein
MKYAKEDIKVGLKFQYKGRGEVYTIDGVTNDYCNIAWRISNSDSFTSFKIKSALKNLNNENWVVINNNKLVCDYEIC